MKEEFLIKRSPSMFRQKPLTFIGCLLLCPFLVGFVLFFKWWLQTIDETIFVTDKYILYRRGVFDHDDTQIYHSDISQLNIKATWQQRIMGTGTLEIGSSATSELEVRIEGLSNPKEIKFTINSNR